jgi:hypothetical protein
MTRSDPRNMQPSYPRNMTPSERRNMPAFELAIYLAQIATSKRTLQLMNYGMQRITRREFENIHSDAVRRENRRQRKRRANR